MTKKKSNKHVKLGQKPRVSPVSKARNRTLQRPWRSQPGMPKAVSEYLPKAGMTARVSEELFRSNLRARFGDAAEPYLESCRVSDCASAEAYAAMSPNLDMAMAIRSQIWGDRYEAFLSWLVTAGLPRPRRVLDMGFDTGIQTCFLATFYPNAQVTGVDQCVKSVRCAQRLAERLGLANAEFVQASAPEPPCELVGNKYDMVVSSFVAGYFRDEQMVPMRSIEEAQSEPVGPKALEYAQLLASFLADEDSLLVGFERCPVPVRLARWIQALRGAGIYIREHRIELIEFSDESDELASAPAFVASKRVADVMTPDEIRHLWLKNINRHGHDSAYHFAAIEHDFLSAGRKELLKGAHCTFPDIPPYCKELWLAGSDVLLYVFDRNGGVILDVAPSRRTAKNVGIVRNGIPRRGADGDRGIWPGGLPQPPAARSWIVTQHLTRKSRAKQYLTGRRAR